MPQVESLSEFDVLQHGDIEQVFQARLIMAVEIGVFQNPFTVAATNVKMPLEGNRDPA